MPIDNRNIPVNEARQEIRQLARDLNFEFRQLGKRVDDLCARLYGEARAIRQEHRAKKGLEVRAPGRISRDPITVFHGPEGRTTKKGHD